jgi:hypothetical protein
MMNKSNGPIILWTHPRACSSAFERAVYQLKSQVVLEHEPYLHAYYLSRQRKTTITSYLSSPVQTEIRDYDEVTLQLVTPLENGKRVFSKDFAYCVDTELMSRLADAGTMFAFLIRKPEKSIPSLFKIQNSQPEYYAHKFYGEEVGLIELNKLYNYIRNVLGLPAAVYDADDLLSCPEKVLRHFCRSVGLNFEESMLKWKEGDIPHQWLIMKGWYHDATVTNGFTKTADHSRDNVIEELDVEEDVRKSMQKALRESQIAYDELYAQRVTF